MEIYETVKSIGSGSFGQVYLSRNKREDKLYVIKRIKTRDISEKDREAIENEVIWISLNPFKFLLKLFKRSECCKNSAMPILWPTRIVS